MKIIAVQASQALNNYYLRNLNKLINEAQLQFEQLFYILLT